LVRNPKSPNRFITAPVSHQKLPEQNRTNTIEIKRTRSKINEPDRYSAAHNGLVAGSSPAGPTKKSAAYQVFISSPDGPPHQKRQRFVAYCRTSVALHAGFSDGL
jgi:hypothetical protein